MQPEMILIKRQMTQNPFDSHLITTEKELIRDLEKWSGIEERISKI